MSKPQGNVTQLRAVRQATSDIIPATLGNEDEGSKTIPHGGDRPSVIVLPPTAADDDGCRIVASSALLLRSQERVSATGSSELWGLHVRAGGVTLFVGETSAGKTVFLHNFARAMAAGEEFLGIPPPRPLRVLSLDFESFEDVYVDNLAAIGTADGWDFLEIDELERGPALIEHVSGLVTAKGYDIVIVGPLMEAYPVRDENDNAQANVQMLAFRALARSTRAGVVTVHNSGMRRGKGKRAPEKFLGRGATARLDRADVGINFTAEGADVRALHVSKSRSANLNDRIEFRFSGELGYELIESNAPSPAVVATLGREALAVVTKEIGSGNAEVERRTIMEALRVEKGTASEQALDRALRQTVAAGLLRRVRKGAYALAEAATEAMARPDGATPARRRNECDRRLPTLALERKGRGTEPAPDAGAGGPRAFPFVSSCKSRAHMPGVLAECVM